MHTEVDWDVVDRVRAKISAPSGSFTVLDYAKRYGISRSAANEQLSKLFKEGKLDRCIPVPGKAVYYTVKSKQEPAVNGVHSRNQRRGSKPARVTD